MKIEDIYHGNHKWLANNTIYLTVHGSRAYGTNTAKSDTDVKGVCIAPKETYLGFASNIEQVELKDVEKDVEGTIYELRKFASLASNCNPNIIELLFIDESDHLIVTPWMEPFLNNKEKFLSTKCKHTFSGYAMSQLRRIKSHRSWLLDPPKSPPDRKDYGLPSNRKLSKTDYGAVKNLKEQGHEFSEEIMHVFAQEKGYASAKKHYDQYQQWKKNRNPKRAALEAKYGFDCKHGMHLVRLMRMGAEILEFGKVNVKRPDAEELLAIRNGAWSYDELIEWAEAQDEKLSELYETSTLPKKADVDFIENLCVESIHTWLKDK